MKSLYFLFIIISFCSLKLSSQNLPTNIGAQSSAMGGVGVAESDFWSSSNNQASLGFNEKIGAGIYYENRFLLRELGLKAFSLTLPTKSGSFGINLSSFGYSKYNESKYGLAYGLALSPYFSIGLQMDYLQTSIANNYGKKNLFTFEIGLLTKITPEVTLGVHIFNPLQVKINNYNNEKTLPLMKVGAEWKLDENFTSAIEFQSDTKGKLMIKSGLEYCIRNVLYPRIGISDNPNVFSFGFGLKLNSFIIDFSSSMHQVLGYSPQISLVYVFKKS